MAIPLYQQIARALHTMGSLSTTKEQKANQKEALLRLVKEHMPSGSGFDAGTQIDLDESTPDRLVFTTSFHHMNEHGFYDGWTEHIVTVYPSLAFGATLTIGGYDKNQIKEYIEEVFADALRKEV